MNKGEGLTNNRRARIVYVLALCFASFLSLWSVQTVIRQNYYYRLDFWIIFVIVCAGGYLYPEYRDLTQSLSYKWVGSAIIVYGLILLHRKYGFIQTTILFTIFPLTLFIALFRGLIEEYKRREEGSPLLL